MPRYHLVLVNELVEALSTSIRLATIDLLRAELLLGVLCSVWVEAEQNLLVGERVLLLYRGALGDAGAAGGSQDRLDFGRVDQLGDVRLRDGGGRQEEVLLQGRWLGGGTVDLVQSLESARCPDDEATEVATWGELEQVEREHGACLDTWDVTESKSGLLAIGLWVVDDERTTALAPSSTSHLTLTGAELSRLLDLCDVWACTNLCEQLHGGAGLGELEGGRGDNEWDLWDVRDAVTAGKEKRSTGGGSNGGCGCEALLAERELDVPLAPDLGCCD